MTIRILLAEDHCLVREGLRRIVSSYSDLEVVAEASSGLQAVELAIQYEPEIVVMDIGMKDLNGIEATEQIVGKRPKIAVLILTMFGDEAYVTRALRAGARSYILKDAAEQELILALRALHTGQSFFSPAIARLLLENFRSGTSTQQVDHRYELLSARERQIYQMLAEGKANKEIGNVLKISVHTVETHRVRIMEKLDLHSLAELVLSAVRRGVVCARAALTCPECGACRDWTR